MEEFWQGRGEKVLVYGAGNVAYSFVPALQGVFGAAGVEVYSRSAHSARALGTAYGVRWHYGEWWAGEEYVLCVVLVPDAAVVDSVKRLDSAGRLVVHTSGSVPLVELERGKGGVVYPLQSFAKGERSELRGVPLYVEGQDSAVLEEVKRLASCISGRVRELRSADRERLHIGGVVVNNFVYRLLVMVQELSRGAESIAVGDYAALLRTTVARGLSEDGGSRQTGPARRGDVGTILRHLQVLSAECPELLGPYVAMTDSILSARAAESTNRERK